MKGCFGELEVRRWEMRVYLCIARCVGGMAEGDSVFETGAIFEEKTRALEGGGADWAEM
jgi:hypothetical protein